MQERLLRESDLDLSKTTEICRIVEITRLQTHVIYKNSAVHPGYKVGEIRRLFSNHQKSQTESPESTKKCNFCSFSHKIGYGKLLYTYAIPVKKSFCKILQRQKS